MKNFHFIGSTLLFPTCSLHQKAHGSKYGEFYVDPPYPTKKSGFIDTMKGLTSKDLTHILLEWLK